MAGASAQKMVTGSPLTRGKVYPSEGRGGNDPAPNDGKGLFRAGQTRDDGLYLPFFLN